MYTVDFLAVCALLLTAGVKDQFERRAFALWKILVLSFSSLSSETRNKVVSVVSVWKAMTTSFSVYFLLNKSVSKLEILSVKLQTELVPLNWTTTSDLEFCL